jgi:hypothetical protein
MDQHRLKYDAQSEKEKHHGCHSSALNSIELILLSDHQIFGVDTFDSTRQHLLPCML